MLPAGFLDFWRAYPRKESRDKAIKAWLRLAPDEELQRAILAALERHKRCPQWTKDNGQYIPHPTTWLNGRRWEDQPIANGAPSSNGWTDTLRAFVEGGEQ